MVSDSKHYSIQDFTCDDCKKHQSELPTYVKHPTDYVYLEICSKCMQKHLHVGSKIFVEWKGKEYVDAMILEFAKSKKSVRVYLIEACKIYWIPEGKYWKPW